MNDAGVRLFLRAMAVFWLIFGLITLFVPSLMGLFQTPDGVAARTAFSDHVWMHDGLDILAVALLVFGASMAAVSRPMLNAAAFANLLPAAGIANSLVATPYWNPLFLAPLLGLLGLAVWGFVQARKV